MVRCCFLGLVCCATLTADSLAQLGQLEENGHIFALRDLLDADSAKQVDTLIYRAITNSRFGREREAIPQFRALLATHPPPDVEQKARYEMSSALARLGEYDSAALEIAAALRLHVGDEHDRADAANALALLESLSGVPPQTIEFGRLAPIQARRNELGLWAVPVEVNSRRGEWIFDTGANFSAVSESEARRLGLAIRDVRVYARKFDGTTSPARAAVAKELRIGSARLSNVVLLVQPDQELHIPVLKHQIHGIVGMPVLRALECMEFSSQGVLTLDCGRGPVQGIPNMFFDGLTAIVQARHFGHGLQMMLDTGARATVLFPSVRASLANWEISQLAGSENVGARGAPGRGQGTLVPSIQLDLRGRTIFLQRIPLLSQTPPGSAGQNGILGIDALAGGFRLDFRCMQFALK